MPHPLITVVFNIFVERALWWVTSRGVLACGRWSAAGIVHWSPDLATAEKSCTLEVVSSSKRSLYSSTLFETFLLLILLFEPSFKLT